MKSTIPCAAAIFLAAGLCGSLQANTGYIDDPAGLIPEVKSQALEEKLGRFEREFGIRILMRFHAHSPGEAEDSAPGVFMRTLSAKLGVQESGVLAVHFADEDDWRLWIGDNLTARFISKPGTAAEHTKSGAMHDAKEAWLEHVFARADSAWKQASPGTPNTEKRVGFVAESIADGLLEKIRPAPANP